MEHIAKELYNLRKTVGRDISCPVCLEDTTEGSAALSVCGHYYCRTCLETLSRCALCRHTLPLKTHDKVILLQQRRNMYPAFDPMRSALRAKYEMDELLLEQLLGIAANATDSRDFRKKLKEIFELDNEILDELQKNRHYIKASLRRALICF